MTLGADIRACSSNDCNMQLEVKLSILWILRC